MLHVGKKYLHFPLNVTIFHLMQVDNINNPYMEHFGWPDKLLQARCFHGFSWGWSALLTTWKAFDFRSQRAIIDSGQQKTNEPCLGTKVLENTKKMPLGTMIYPLQKSHFWRYICSFSSGGIWMFPKIVVPPKSSILIGSSIINHPFWGTPIFGNTHMLAPYRWYPSLKTLCFPKNWHDQNAPELKSSRFFGLHRFSPISKGTPKPTANDKTRAERNHDFRRLSQGNLRKHSKMNSDHMSIDSHNIVFVQHLKSSHCHTHTHLLNKNHQMDQKSSATGTQTQTSTFNDVWKTFVECMLPLSTQKISTFHAGNT